MFPALAIQNGKELGSFFEDDDEDDDESRPLRWRWKRSFSAGAGSSVGVKPKGAVLRKSWNGQVGTAAGRARKGSEGRTAGWKKVFCGCCGGA